MPPKVPKPRRRPESGVSSGGDSRPKGMNERNPLGDTNTDDAGYPRTSRNDERFGEADKRHRADQINWLTSRESAENHYKSDVDSNRLAQHHTLGNSANQASAGNHTHDGSNGLVIPNVTGVSRLSWTPTWSSQNNPQPALGNGTLDGHYARFGPIVFFTMRLLAGSTTTYGNGFYSFFGLPVQPATVGPENLAYGNLNNGGGNFPVGAVILPGGGGQIHRVIPSDAKAGGTPLLDNTGWKGAWANGNFLFLQGWYWAV